jgi:predicted PurR-regulated permease PerM
MRRETIFFVIFFAVIALMAIAVAGPFLTYIVLAGILTYTLFPIYQFLLRRTGRPQLSSALCIVMALTLMILPALYLVSALVEQFSGAYDSFQAEAITPILNRMSGLTGNRVDFEDLFNDSMGQISKQIVDLAPNILGSVTEVFLGLFVMFFVMFYGFREGKGFLSHVRAILPLDPDLNDSLFHELQTVTQAVLYGQVITAIVQGGIGGLGLLVFGVPNWLFWGTLMILLALIPVLGTPLIWVPAAVGLILNGNTASGIGLLIFGATVVMNIDNFLRPRLVSGKTKVHPVLILIGVFGGLRIFGFIGMLVGPLILALLVALVKFYEQHYARKSRPAVAPAPDVSLAASIAKVESASDPRD